MEFHNPGNHLKRIDKVWMFVSVDDTGEGVVAYPMAGMGSVPLVAADEKRLKQLIPLAKDLAKKYNIKIRLIELSTRTEVESYGGVKTGDARSDKWVRDKFSIVAEAQGVLIYEVNIKVGEVWHGESHV